MNNRPPPPTMFCITGDRYSTPTCPPSVADPEQKRASTQVVLDCIKRLERRTVERLERRRADNQSRGKGLLSTDNPWEFPPRRWWSMVGRASGSILRHLGAVRLQPGRDPFPQGGFCRGARGRQDKVNTHSPQCGTPLRTTTLLPCFRISFEESRFVCCFPDTCQDAG